MALKIGDLANATGTKVQTIRYYEEIGLLPPPARTEGNYRTYDEGTLRRLSFIRRSRDLGFSLDRVRELLALSDHRDWSCTSVETIAREHRKAIERKVADLSALDRELAVAARNDDRPELQYRAVFGSHCVRRIDAGNARSVRQKPHSVRPTRNADPLAYGRQKAVVSARAAFRAGMVEYRRPPSEGHNRSVLTLETAAALARTEL